MKYDINRNSDYRDIHFPPIIPTIAPFYEGPDPKILPRIFQERVNRALAAAFCEYQPMESKLPSWKMVVTTTLVPERRADTMIEEWIDYQSDFDSTSGIERCPEQYGYSDGLLSGTISFIDLRSGTTNYPIAIECLQFLRPEALLFTCNECVATHISYEIYRAYRVRAKEL